MAILSGRWLIGMGPGLVTVALAVGMPLQAAEPVPPKDALERLAAENFKQREDAQADLLTWARKNPRESKDWIYQRLSKETDPEVRRRCTAVLREVVLDDYQRDGEGYAGISMQVAAVVVPGDANPRFGIRIMQVVPNAPAAKANLQIGEVVVGAGGQVWREATADKDFQNWIRGQKPGTKVTLKILRQNQVVDVPLVLDRRPVGLEAVLPFGGQAEDAQKLDRDAKDTYFRNWMDRRQAGK